MAERGVWAAKENEGMKRSEYLGMTTMVLVAVSCLFESRPARAASADIPMATPPGVTLQGTRYGDSKGMTLYTSDKDVQPGKSNCTEDCVKTWSPVTAPANTRPSGNWSVALRADGMRQWAFKGKPTYTFTGDKQVGDAKGNEADGGSWHALSIDLVDGLAMPAGIDVREVNDADGRSLVDDRGLTLYVFDDSASRGKGPISEDWRPLQATQIANPVGDFSVVSRHDGTEQWAYKGKPLYTFEPDVSVGHAKGVGTDPRLEAALVARYFMPSNVIIRSNIGYGTVLATTSGTALYMRDGFRYQVGTHHTRNASRGVPSVGRSIGIRGCDAACLEIWRPFVASNDAQPSGHWTILTRPDGTRQWAYRGYALYTNVRDKQPGDMTGNDTYDYLISQDAGKVSDPTLSTSLLWHVVYP